MNAKKLISLVMALVMVLALSTSAMAANDSITINNAKPGETYTLYKLLDLEVDNADNPSAYSYTVNEDWAEFFAADSVAAYVTFTGEYVTGISDAAALANAAANWADKPDPIDTVTCAKDATTVVFENLDDGYYLITSSLGTLAMTETTPSKTEVIINEKNPQDTIEKEVKEDSTEKYGKENDAQVGDTVDFHSTATLYPNTRNVVIHDTMDSGLDLIQDSVNITGLTKDTDYKVEFGTADGCDFEITFTETYLSNLTAATTLTVNYEAVLNENAIVKGENGVAIVDQYNKTKVTFGDAQSVEDQTVTTTHKVTVNKYAEDIEDLAGAVFSLKKGDAVVLLIKLDDNNYRVAKSGEADAVETFTTVATGDIVIWGLDTDTDYTLVEITAPNGYNTLTNPVNVTVNADNSSQVNIENQSGTELPSTGGMGTTVIYIAGGLLVAAALIMMINKRRAGAAE